MQDGIPGLFKDDNGSICCNIRDGDDGIALEELLPPQMRGDGFAKAPVPAFIDISLVWFAGSSQWDRWWNEVQSPLPIGHSKRVRKQPPALNIQKLKLQDADGQVDYNRLEQLYSLIWPYWDRKPPIGLIALCIADDVPFSEIKRMLALHDQYSDKIEHIDRCFASVFLPPAAERGELACTEEHVHYAARWCRHPDGGDELSQDALMWNLNFRELGIVTADGAINRNVAEAARIFIWNDRKRKPDFFALRDHLAPLVPKTKPSNDNGKPLPKSFRDKLKKRQRKAGKVRRRKGR